MIHRFFSSLLLVRLLLHFHPPTSEAQRERGFNGRYSAQRPLMSNPYLTRANTADRLTTSRVERIEDRGVLLDDSFPIRLDTQIRDRG